MNQKPKQTNVSLYNKTKLSQAQLKAILQRQAILNAIIASTKQNIISPAKKGKGRKKTI